jgi:preprotein translocase subunit YajC
MFHLLMLLADNPPPQNPTPWWYQMVLPAGFVFILYFLIMRPRRGEADRQAFLTGLKKNDKIITTAGIYGTVVAVAEKEDEVTVRVDDNVKLKMLKSAIARNLTNEEAFKAAQAKGAAKPAAPATDTTAVTTTPKT